MTLNGSVVRDIGRVLKISTGTVTSELKKTPHVNPYAIDMIEKEKLNELEVDLFYTAELDEFWSFVGSKSEQRWTWLAMDKKSGIILAWHNGKRTDKDFRTLLSYLNRIPIAFYYSDSWSSYSKYLPNDIHYIGKNKTWKIERKNLNFRTHLKTVSISKISPFNISIKIWLIYFYFLKIYINSRD